MVIRAALIEELDDLNKFYFEMNKVINMRANEYNPDNPVFPSPEMVEEAISDHEQFVGIEDGSIVCACIANNKCTDEYDTVKWHVELSKEEYLVLHALRVSTNYEGRGFAKQMLNYIINLAREKGLKAVRLDVLDGYSVEKLYIASGFEYVDTIEILYDDIGRLQKFRLLELVI